MDNVIMNLNDTATFQLTEYGREVWRTHCRTVRETLASIGVSYDPKHTGEETELRLQFWRFIEAFGKAPWGLGHHEVCSMEVKIESETAALIARLHGELEEAHRGIKSLDQASRAALETARLLERERDEQRARAEMVEGELTKRPDGDDLAVLHAKDIARRERARELFGAKLNEPWYEAAARFKREMLAMEQGRAKEAERLRADLAAARGERDEAKRNFGIASRQFEELGAAMGRAPDESPIMAAMRVKIERDEAREQLAKVEWVGTWYPEKYRLPMCVICQNVKPSDEARKVLGESALGHKPDCWFAKQTLARQREIAAIIGPEAVRTQVRDPARLAPKFAVGEWVTYAGESYEVMQQFYTHRWAHEVRRPDGIMWSVLEHDLTAQTPQHKHDCAGCVFLGRYSDAIATDLDLWFSPKGSAFVTGPSLVAFDGNEWRECSAAAPTDAWLKEARRRAEARGLAK